MTTNEIILIARKKLLEAGTEILDDETVLIYANQVYLDLQKKTFPNSAIKTASVVFVNGIATPPTDFGTIYGDAYDVNNNFFSEMSIADFARLGGVGTGLVVQAGQIKLSPTQNLTLTVPYYPKFNDLTTVQNPQIDAYFHEPIIYGIMARAFEDLQDFELALTYQNKYKEMVIERTGVLSNYEEDGQRGGQMFNGINIVGGGTANDPNHW